MVMMGGVKHEDEYSSQEELVTLSFPAAGLAVIELNDPKRANSMDDAIAVQFAAVVEKVQRTEGVRGVILQGNGDHFCTGINPYTFVRTLQKDSVLHAASRVFRVYSAFTSIAKLSIPVIAVVHGKVVGGGFALMLNADWRIAVKASIFNYGNLPRGVCPGLQLSRSLNRAVGTTRTMGLYLDDPTLDTGKN